MPKTCSWVEAWLQTSWGGSGCEKFTLVLETNCIRQLERKQAQIIVAIILQILTTEQTSARETHATIKGMNISMTTLICSRSDHASVPMIVNETIWARCLASCFVPLVSNTKVSYHSQFSLSATRVTTLWSNNQSVFTVLIWMIFLKVWLQQPFLLPN